MGLRYFFEAAAKKNVPTARLTEGVSYAFEHLNDPRERIDWASFARCCHNAGEVWTDEELVELGRNIIWHPSYRWVRVVCRVLYTPKELYFASFAPRGQWHQLYPRLPSTIREVEPDRLVVELSVPDELAPCRVLFLAQLGACISLPRVTGAAEAGVHMDELERGRRYRYRIRVPRGGGALARVRRTVSWPFTARAAARELAEAHALLARRYDELEAQVARREQLEQQMLQTQKLESLGVLAGGIAHDFNNLLMSISGNAALAKHHIENNTARGFVSKIETASQRASALTRSLLAYAGKGSLRRERIDLSALAREMSSLLGVGVSAKTRLDYDLADEIWVEGDATQLCQVLMNLVTNAAEALSESGDTIVVSTGRLEVTGPGTCGVLGKELAQGSYVFCEVRDRGSGMSRETQKRIFDPFFTTKSSGRGLGLAAVLGIVASHGGRVMVDSEEGVGTTFRVVLPRAQANDVGQQHDADRVAAWGNSTRLLVVDDDANVAAVTAMLLRTLGFEVTVVDSGQGAVEQFREAPEGYRAVVIDATMPDMDGVTTIAELRRIRDVPVVVMSGHAEEDMTEHLRAHRDVAFLQKPFGLSALDACLRKRLGAETEARVAASGALRRAPH